MSKSAGTKGWASLRPCQRVAPTLRQALQSWDHYQQKIAECDRQIQSVLPPFDPDQPAPPRPKTPKPGGVNSPDIPMLREIQVQMSGGRDLTQLPAHAHYSVLRLIGEAGTDLTKWPTALHRVDRPGSGQPRQRQAQRSR